MTWHEPSDEQPADPRLSDVLIFAAVATAWLVWLASVGLAR